MRKKAAGRETGSRVVSGVTRELELQWRCEILYTCFSTLFLLSYLTSQREGINSGGALHIRSWVCAVCVNGVCYTNVTKPINQKAPSRRLDKNP